ncbi:TetR/AcrR family transcriptional regulator [Salipaludibacillus aurantiacus]|uniref:DNA-binding transcriptional regulator, AcrR family n=1 Tax=Salipaludibacillus aurantiacus TaxID=1601833 RepID=A0A1H9USU5_9BACI|nr:helix-turn-helix domain-containing protein [Salipaludibacillus aurantiacus]SES12565.1 DNA-binding transcriptional regulator, AcrR family [Salipaludibacillus aurantiacus]
MRDKTEQIIQSALQVFIRKGFQATTQEVANEAKVAEVTLFRKFGNKQQLFITVIKSVLEKKFYAHLIEQAKTHDTEEFLRSIIDNRLNVLSRNRNLVKMVIAESLMGNLPPEINLPDMIFTSLTHGIEQHAQQNNLVIDSTHWARQLSGIFLSHLILPADKPYYELSEREKNHLLDKYISAFVITE